jgi:selenocysteine-specific elongation factor
MIIGTAGHIDHGKTSLVRALTGVDTDRLPEEKARGITLDLGFAYPRLETGGALGFVDVPGHERLVHTMIAGASGIDAALLVVAADDGVMPQTLEHLRVLSLLGVGNGVVALTKIDLVDAERALEVEIAIEAALAATTLRGAEVFPLSTLTGAGVEPLRSRLWSMATTWAARGDDGLAFRLAIDRAFSLPGAGTIVTGSIVSGLIAVGETVVLTGDATRARVRGIHVNGRPADTAGVGDRCALNLAGARKDAIHRGDWALAPSHTMTSARCEVALDWREERPKSGAAVLVHHGAAHALARIVPLSAADGLARLSFDRALPLRVGDRLVLRDVGATRTLGGARVLDPSPAPGRRLAERVELARARGGAVAAWLDTAGLARADHLRDAWGWREPPAGLAPIGDFLATREGLGALRAATLTALGALHQANPSAPGASAEAVRLALPRRLPRDGVAALLAGMVADGAVIVEAHLFRLPTHRASMAPAEAAVWDAVRRVLETAGNRPPLLRELAATLRLAEPACRRSCKAFARLGLVVEMAPDRFFLAATADSLAAAARAVSATSPDGWFTAAAFRDVAGTGRQLGIQVLDYLDRRGVTIRRGDLRRARLG